MLFHGRKVAVYRIVKKLRSIVHLCCVSVELQQFRKDAIQQLIPLYDQGEATAIIDILIEHFYLIKPHQLLYLHKVLSAKEVEHMLHLLGKLKAGMPLQYLLGEAHFGNYKFLVNEHVLIPRPETFELVEWIIEDYTPSSNASIIDIGTGSGCIAVSLAKELKSAHVSALDVSPQALEVAQQNARRYGVSINWILGDITHSEFQKTLGEFDIIVSNPPYIKQSESASMHENVLKHEPHLALFVQDDDALLFYKTIAQFGLSHLKAGGLIYAEINQELAYETAEVFTQMGYADVSLRKDLNGHWRMIKARKSAL